MRRHLVRQDAPPSAGEAADATGLLGLARLMVGQWPAPALLADRQGAIIMANEAAGGLAVALEGPSGASLASEIAASLRSGAAKICRHGVRSADRQATIEFSLVPLRDGAAGPVEGVLAMGRDVTAERDLTNALVASRQLFKDLVTCSSDFGWETAEDGVFGYVSPQGGFGYSADDLVGLDAAKLLDAARSAGETVFAATAPYRNRKIWLKRKDGGFACVLMAGVPRHDAAGHWIGARGMCQDVTQSQTQVERDRLLGGIVDSIRDVADPREMLDIASREIAAAFSPADCGVMRKVKGGFQLAAFCGLGWDRPADVLAALPFDLSAVFGAACEGGFALSEGRFSIIAAPSRYQGRTNGGVIVRRSDGQRPWSDAECALLDEVAAHLGIAMEQFRGREALEGLTRVDELTGLLNRRAFSNEVEKRITHQSRTGRCAALLYFDLDNFKLVNDRFGHQAGDEVLKRLADALARSIRAADFAARIGGDEFLVWLEETGAEGAAAKAGTLLKICDQLDDLELGGGRKLSLSIGVAVSDPKRREPLDSLIERADKAMYEVKRRGKAGYGLAPEREGDCAC